MLQDLSFKYTMDPNNMRYSSLLPVFPVIFPWKNVATYHGNALTAVWMLFNITRDYACIQPTKWQIRQGYQVSLYSKRRDG